MMNFLESLKKGLFESFAEDDRVVLLGEDIVDPYGGAFKVSLGLSSLYPDRVLNTPISEAGFTGAAGGMAIRGLRPVVEIMFGDFLTLCTDQIVNHITKFASMYPGVEVPLVIRTPMGGGRGYGATHSQTLEKMYLGVPGLKVVAPGLAHDPGKIVRTAVLKDSSPVLFIENKALYSRELIAEKAGELTVKEIETSTGYPVAVVSNMEGSRPDVVVLAYGGASLPLCEVMEQFADEEISIKALFPSLINEVDMELLLPELRGCGNIVICEEGSEGFNWGSEMAACIYEKMHRQLRNPILRVAAENTVIPCAKKLEDAVLLNENKIEQAIMELLS
ncbi:pyruvate dehydrogenase [Desulfomarina profundi]|uniref:Pyruvate dehydrogenase n=1 Tax=Desulfomarina profundi TaxID=2772557 RepID=A0A8D5FSG3_9BACT|nr:transketolase C-terminal domain-containing protein [Desulfomarina profundi]BCL60566.1 pyruvate dehydrogenase [Desulfomarina profundi]